VCCKSVGVKLERAAQIGIQMSECGHGSCVWSQGAIQTGGFQQPKRRLVGAGALLRRERWSVVEDTVAVVVHAGDDVIRSAGGSVELAGERELLRQVELPDGEQPVRRLPGSASGLPVVGVTGLR